MMTLFLSIISMASAPRIESGSMNRSLPQKIFISYGRSSVLVFPCNVVTFSDGPTKDIKAKLFDRDSKMLEVWFTKNSPEPQELKVFCQEERFVFDIMPNQSTHQSIYEVTRSYRAMHFEKEQTQDSKSEILSYRPKILKVIADSAHAKAKK